MEKIESGGMSMPSVPLRQQLQNNFVALISLIVAIVALLYSSWRADESEKNQTWREAQFEMLKNLGQLQSIVNNAYFVMDSERANPFLGWSHVSFISDLAMLLPQPVPEAVGNLVLVWGQKWEELKSDKDAVTEISTAIDETRKATVSSIHHLR